MNHRLPKFSPQSLLILGGARSGKSRFAETVATAHLQQAGNRVVMITTAEGFDDEMRARIQRHQDDRAKLIAELVDPARFLVVEEPRALAATLTKHAAPNTLLLVDCLTLWLTNIMLAGEDCEASAKVLATSLSNLPGRLVLVSNELGLGIVPQSTMGRSFRDAQGRLNQLMAERCDTVMMMIAGLPMRLKPSPYPE